MVQRRETMDMGQVIYSGVQHNVESSVYPMAWILARILPAMMCRAVLCSCMFLCLFSSAPTKMLVLLLLF